MQSFTAILSLFSFSTLALAVPAPRTFPTHLSTIVTLRLDSDIANVGSIQIDITVGTQLDTHFLLEGAQIQIVEGGDINPANLVCMAANQSTIVGEFTLA